MSEANTVEKKEVTRYQVGRKEYFISLDYKSKDGFPMYLPWEDQLNKLILIEVEAVEHHKVAWNQDPTEEKKYDGFVFKLTRSNDELFKEGMLFDNQFPSASYGQMSDSNDWRLDLRLETEGRTNEQVMDDPLVEYAYGRHRFEDVETFLSNINRGIRDRAFQTDEHAEKKKALESFYKQITDKLEELYGVKVELKEYGVSGFTIPRIVRD